MAPRVDRRLAAVMAVDVVGYSRLIGVDEAGTLARVKAHRVEFAEPLIAEYHGRVVKLTGDGALVEFASAVDAVECAVAIQAGMAEREAAGPEAGRIRFRIGINIGDIVLEDGDIFGDGVNVAARLEGLAEPGGICIARNVYNQVKGKLDLAFEPMGEHKVKNIVEPITVYRARPGSGGAARTRPAALASGSFGGRWAAIAAAAIVLLAAGVAGAWYAFWLPAAAPPAVVAQTAGSGAVQARPALPLPDKPSIAVLPFRNFSGDPRQDYFADAFTDEVITELSRSRFLFVIASNSTFTYKGKAVKVQDVARELGVQYVLEGSIQRSGDRLRVTAQLVDAIADHHVWAETYVRDAKDIFNVQDEVAQKIVATIGPGASTELARAVRERAKRKNPADLKAYEYFLLGLELDERFTKQSVAEGRKLIAKAIELDPNFARAYAEMAWVHYYDSLWGWSDDPDFSARKALEFAKMAVSVDDADEKAHWTLGAMYYKIERDFDKGVTEYQRALTINPNYADLMHSWGYLLAYLGRPEEGILEMQKARRLNPHYPDWYNTNLGAALYIAGRYQDAIATLKLIREQNPDSQTFLAASYAQLGRHAEALAMAAEIGKAYPDFSSRAWAEKLPFKSEVDRDHFVEGLKKAGLPN